MLFSSCSWDCLFVFGFAVGALIPFFMSFYREPDNSLRGIVRLFITTALMGLGFGTAAVVLWGLWVPSLVILGLEAVILFFNLRTWVRAVFVRKILL